MKPYLLPSDKNLSGVGVEGKGGWENDDYHMYHEHGDRLFAFPAHNARFFYRISDLWADSWSSKQKSSG